METNIKSHKRLIANIIIIILILGLGVGMYFTVRASGSFGPGGAGGPGMSSSSGAGQMTPPDSTASEQSDSTSASDDSTQVSGDSAQASSDSTQSDDQAGGTPPEMPDGEQGGGTPPSGDSGQDGGTPPEMPNGSTGDQAGQGGQPGQGGDGAGMPSIKIATKYYVLFGVEAVLAALLIAYLICSRANKRNVSETFAGAKRIAAFIIIAVVLSGGLMAGECYAATHHLLGGGPGGAGGPGGSSSEQSVEANGETVVDGTEETLTEEYSTSKEDYSAILVKNGGTLTLKNATVTKTGDSSNTENSEFYGVNAGVLTTSKSTTTITGCTIGTDAKGANAVFCTGEGSKVYVSDTKITTTGESSARGLDATYGGYIEADNVEISTKGGSCASLATDRGEGTVTVTDSTLKTAGAGSPVIYSTGDISVTNCKGTATGSQIACIEGKNSATITDSTMTASGTGNRGDVDQCGVFIYQSMSGDASEGTGTFTAKNSTLSVDKDSSVYKTAPMFFVTNTAAEINLENNTLNYGSGVLLSIGGTDEWGQKESNGGDVTFTATDQELAGEIKVDEISTLALNLEKGTEFTGAINTDNTGKEVTLKLDSDATITLTADSYVTSLDDSDSSYSNINLNGHKLYVNGKALSI